MTMAFLSICKSPFKTHHSHTYAYHHQAASSRVSRSSAPRSTEKRKASTSKTGGGSSKRARVEAKQEGSAPDLHRDSTGRFSSPPQRKKKKKNPAKRGASARAQTDVSTTASTQRPANATDPAVPVAYGGDASLPQMLQQAELVTWLTSTADGSKPGDEEVEEDIARRENEEPGSVCRSPLLMKCFSGVSMWYLDARTGQNSCKFSVTKSSQQHTQPLGSRGQCLRKQNKTRPFIGGPCVS